MKLHLPKMLLAAVLCAVGVAYGMDVTSLVEFNVGDITSNQVTLPSGYTYTTSGTNIAIAGYSKDGSVVHGIEGEGTDPTTPAKTYTNTYTINTNADANLISATDEDLIIIDLNGKTDSTNGSWLYTANTPTSYTIAADVRIDQMKLTNGSSDRTYNFSGAISGDGEFTDGWKNNVFVFQGDVTGYTGAINLNRTDGFNVTLKYENTSGVTNINSTSVYAKTLALNGTEVVIGTDSQVAAGTLSIGTDTLTNNGMLTIGNNVSVASKTFTNNGTLKLGAQLTVANQSLGKVVFTNDAATVTTDGADTRTVSLTSLKMESNGTLRISNYNGSYTVGALNLGENKTLTLDAKSNHSQWASFKFTGDTACEGTGTINLKHTGNNNGSRVGGLWVTSENAISGAVVNMVQMSGSNDASTLNLILSASNVNIAGLSTAEDAINPQRMWVVSNANLSNASDSTVRTLTITGDGDYKYAGGVKGSVNLNMTGEGTQTFKGNMNNFNGNLSVTNGTLVLEKAVNISEKTLTLGAGGTATLQAEVRNGDTEGTTVTVGSTVGTIAASGGKLANSKDLTATLINTTSGTTTTFDNTTLTGTVNLDMKGGDGNPFRDGKLYLTNESSLSIGTLWIKNSDNAAILADSTSTVTKGAVSFSGITEGTDGVLTTTADLNKPDFLNGSLVFTNAKVTYTGEEGSAEATMAGKLTDSALVVEGGSVKLTNTGNTISKIDAKGGDITLGANHTIGTISIASGQQVALADGAALTNGSFTISGDSATVSATADIADATSIAGSGDASISGATVTYKGTTESTVAAALTNSNIVAESGAVKLTNEGNTLKNIEAKGGDVILAADHSVTRDNNAGNVKLSDGGSIKIADGKTLSYDNAKFTGVGDSAAVTSTKGSELSLWGTGAAGVVTFKDMTVTVEADKRSIYATLDNSSINVQGGTSTFKTIQTGVNNVTVGANGALEADSDLTINGTLAVSKVNQVTVTGNLALGSLDLTALNVTEAGEYTLATANGGFSIDSLTVTGLDGLGSNMEWVITAGGVEVASSGTPSGISLMATDNALKLTVTEVVPPTTGYTYASAAWDTDNSRLNVTLGQSFTELTGDVALVVTEKQWLEMVDAVLAGAGTTADPVNIALVSANGTVVDLAGYTGTVSFNGYEGEGSGTYYVPEPATATLSLLALAALAARRRRKH